MMKNLPLLVVAILSLLVWARPFLAQTESIPPTVESLCKESFEKRKNVIREEECKTGKYIYQPKLKKQVNPSNPAAYQLVGSMHFQIVIDETGHVECIALIDNGGNSQRVIDMWKVAIKKWVYSAPTTDSGCNVALIWSIRINKK